MVVGSLILLFYFFFGLCTASALAIGGREIIEWEGRQPSKH